MIQTVVNNLRHGQKWGYWPIFPLPTARAVPLINRNIDIGSMAQISALCRGEKEGSRNQPEPSRKKSVWSAVCSVVLWQLEEPTIHHPHHPPHLFPGWRRLYCIYRPCGLLPLPTTIQCSTIQYSTVQYSSLQSITIQFPQYSPQSTLTTRTPRPQAISSPTCTYSRGGGGCTVCTARAASTWRLESNFETQSLREMFVSPHSTHFFYEKVIYNKHSR